MSQTLTPTQRAMHDALKTDGPITNGQGWRITTARALADKGLAHLEIRRDLGGTVYFWRARLRNPSTGTAVEPVRTAEPSPVQPSGRYSGRHAVRNRVTGLDTYTQVTPLADAEAVTAWLHELGVPERQHIHGTGGSYIDDTGTLRLVWRQLGRGVLREFVCGGAVYRIAHNAADSCWEVTAVLSGDVVAAGADPDDIEARTRADVAAFNRALRGA
jgi:hypothetical protein